MRRGWGAPLLRRRDDVRLVLGVEAPLVPDVPLVERDVDLLAVLARSLDRVDRRDDAVDEGVHVDGLGEEGCRIPAVLLVVGVHRDVVDLVVRVREDRVLPRAEGRHLPVRRPHRDELDVGVDQAHRLRRLLCEPAVLVRGLVTDLPRAVELVAQAPEPDVERSGCAVAATQVGPVRAAGVVGVLDERAGLVDTARAEVDRLHDLDLGLARPVDELVESERVGLDGVPCSVEPVRTLGHGTDAVLPVVARDEVAAGIADHGGAQLLHEREDVATEAAFVGLRVTRLVDAGVDATAHVLDERAEEAARHVGHGEVAIEDDAGAGHDAPVLSG
ncbi:hypothetical protein QE367_002656 [Microbacterium paludicola]|uniref:Uncharacterized protein n=1 Tax=Microbacterium paludicola TaxID=300019 RepID=A0ABU1I3I9_9MICO|nr:hypothetical protein [Microbacterium paludicola]